jgi:hypothetical protein
MGADSILFLSITDFQHLRANDLNLSLWATRRKEFQMSDSSDADELARLWSLPYSVASQSAIAKLLNKGGGDPTHDRSSEEHFEGIMMLLSLISSKINGVEMTESHSMASAILGKICITAISTQALFRGHEEGRLPFLDHSSIAVLSRAIIEASIMYWYLMEAVTDEEWKFR